MEVLHRGFDGLDLSFKAQIGLALCGALGAAKAQAESQQSDALLDWKGVRLHVAETGAPGGYAFRASTGPLGATWFFKKPNPRDPWGVRASVRSLGIATYGLGATRGKLHAFLEALEITTAAEEVSIGRVDYAVDVLAPELVIDPQHFVMLRTAGARSTSKVPICRSTGAPGASPR